MTSMAIDSAEATASRGQRMRVGQTLHEHSAYTFPSVPERMAHVCEKMLSPMKSINSATIATCTRRSSAILLLATTQQARRTRRGGAR